MKKILQYFHHIHHTKEGHEVHHCGGKHKGVNYTIKHCSCGKHSINRKLAIGHDFEGNKKEFSFKQKCPDSGWHIN